MINKNQDENFNPYVVELVGVLLQKEICYPWNPAEETLEKTYRSPEASIDLFEGLDTQEIEAGSKNLFLSLQKCWTPIPENARVIQSLEQRFGHLVPTQYLEMIAKNAQRVIGQSLQPLNQLVDCVSPLWEEWLGEDLQVLARPLAFSMRGNSTIEIAPWDELSEIERIRLTLSIAQQAIQELSVQE